MIKSAMSVPARYVQFLLAQAEGAGLCTQELLDSFSGEGASRLSDDNCTAYQYGQLYKRVMLATKNEWFAMFSGGQVPLGAFRLMCLVACQSYDLRQALVRSGEFAEVCRGMHVQTQVRDDERFAYLTLTGTRSVSADEFATLQSQTDPNHIMLSLLAAHRFNCWLVGKNLRIRRLTLSFTLDDVVFDPKDLGAETIIENQPINEFVYDVNCLDLPIIQNQDAALEFARMAPYHLVTDDPTSVKLQDKVRSILNRDVGHSMPGAEEVASLLHMSATTLRRRLMAENTSFQALKDQCRLEAALHYLSCPDLTNTMVAEKLGFDEPSAFFRSFKKWTGETPGNYRQQFLHVSD